MPPSPDTTGDASSTALPSGAADIAVGVRHVAIVDGALDHGRLLAAVQHDGIGAITLFVGTVRDMNDGRAVTGMDYDVYRPMAESELGAIAREACVRWPGLVLAVEHRVGRLAIGDASVVIAAAHPHRAQAFDGARYVIDTLKTRVPIWKREHYTDGERRWIDPTTGARDVPQADAPHADAPHEDAAR